MKIGGFSFLNRTNSPRTFGIAAWHSPHSMTWRWLLHWSFFKADERRAHWRLLHWHRNNSGVMAILFIPWAGRFDFQTQQPLWYRDVYVRERDERDRERYVASTARHAAAVKAEAVAMRGDSPLH
jgi:hypothetical protein